MIGTFWKGKSGGWLTEDLVQVVNVEYDDGEEYVVYNVVLDSEEDSYLVSTETADPIERFLEYFSPLSVVSQHKIGKFYV